MQDLNAKLYQKYTGLKRKLLDDGRVRERESDMKEMCEGLREMESSLENLREQNNLLRDELLNKGRQLAETQILLVDKEHQLADREKQLAEARTISVDDTCKTKEFETEISRLKLLLAEKNDTNNYTVPPGVVHNHTPVSPAKRTPELNNIPSSANAIVHHSTFQDEARELECCRRNMRISGNGTDESSSSCVYHILAESLVGMKFSLKNEIEGFSLSIHHEASGYNFTLTWLEQPDGGEWAYKYSSLGTLEKVAFEWMKVQDLRFTMTMCPVFFQRISRLTRQGR